MIHLSMPVQGKAYARMRRFLPKTWRVQTLFSGTCTFLVLAGLAVFAFAQLARASADLHTINSDSVPSVDAAERLEVSLQALAATAADYLSAAGLTDQFDCVLLGQQTSNGQMTNHTCDTLAIPLYIEQIQGYLYQATRNVTYPGEETAIRHIQSGLTSYLQDIAQMQENYVHGKDPSTQQYTYLHQAYLDFSAAENVLTQAISSTPLPTYEQDVPACSLAGTTRELPASEWTQGSLQTQVRCLAAINSTHLNAAYQDAQSFLQTSVIQLILLTLLILPFLFYRLIKVMRITRAGLHIFLTASLLLATIGTIMSISTFMALGGEVGSDTGLVKRAIISDRLSIDAAARIMDYATAANADESRYLIAYNYNDAIAIMQWQLDWQNNIAQVGTASEDGSAMFVAYHNITYHPAEDTAFDQMQQAWQTYTMLDGQIRASVQQGDPKDPNRALPAQRISVGPSDRMFNQFMAATQTLSYINQQDYELTIANAFAQLQQAIWLAPLLLLLAAVCALAGSLAFAREL